MFKELRNYIKNDQFEISYLEGKLNIINYQEIGYMEDSTISLRHKEGKLLIKGKNLRVKKLLDQEILIDGKIESLEFGERV